MAAFRQRFGQGGSARLSAVQCNGIVIASALKVLYLASRLAVILALASAIGCNVRPAEQANLPIASPKVIAFEHDFEMVRPGQTYYHEFENAQSVGSDLDDPTYLVRLFLCCRDAVQF